jgi:phospholipase C
VKPFNGDAYSAQIEQVSLQHTHTSSEVSYNNGKMNGFVYAELTLGKPAQIAHANYSMAYYTNRTIPDYWDYASYYSLDANFFSGAMSYSFPNHVFTVAGNMSCPKPTEFMCGPRPFNYSFPTIINALDSYNISWKYYGGSWNLGNDCKPIKSNRVFGTGLNGKSQSYWNVLPDFPAVQLGPSCHRIQNVNSLFNNIAQGELPAVSWVTPLTNESDHPGLASIPASQLYISKLINALSQNPTLWKTTAIFVTWDEFGGYSDTVVPNQEDYWGSGFRVPLLIISPYARSGVIIPSTQEDFASFLSTIEANWNLPCVAVDCHEASLLNLLNFSQPPKLPLILPSNSLAVYPVSSCISQTLCKTGYMPPTIVTNAPSYPTFTPTAPPDGDFS